MVIGGWILGVLLVLAVAFAGGALQHLLERRRSRCAAPEPSGPYRTAEPPVSWECALCERGDCLRCWPRAAVPRYPTGEAVYDASDVIAAPRPAPPDNPPPTPPMQPSRGAEAAHAFVAAYVRGVGLLARHAVENAHAVPRADDPAEPPLEGGGP